MTQRRGASSPHLCGISMAFPGLLGNSPKHFEFLALPHTIGHIPRVFKITLSSNEFTNDNAINSQQRINGFEDFSVKTLDAELSAPASP